MADISKFSPDSGTTVYNLKDATARADIVGLQAQDTLIKAVQNMFGVHNLMPFNPRIATSVNITSEKRPNGTVRFNTSAASTSTSGFGISSPGFSYANGGMGYSLQAGDYKLVTHTSSALSADIKVQILDDSDTVIIEADSGTDTVVPFTLSAETELFVRVLFASGITLTNFDVQAFIILGSDTDTTYTPYALSNSALTESVNVEIISNCNTNHTDGRLRIYYAPGTSSYCPPVTGTGWYILEFCFGKNYAYQLAVNTASITGGADIGETICMWIRKKENSTTWSTSGMYGWYEIWDSTVHPRLYVHTYEYTPVTGDTRQDLLYQAALNFKTLFHTLPPNYTMEVVGLKIFDHLGQCVNYLLKDRSTSTNQSFVATLLREYPDPTNNRVVHVSGLFDSTAKANNVWVSITFKYDNSIVVNDQSTNALTSGAKYCYLYYRIHREITTDPTIVE